MELYVAATFCCNLSPSVYRPFVSDHYKLELTGNEFYCFKIEAVQFLLLHGLTSNPRHDTSVLLVEISIHGLQC